MKTNNFNHIHYEQLIAALQEESKEKDIIIQLLKDRIYELTAKPPAGLINISYIPIDHEQLISAINYN